MKRYTSLCQRHISLLFLAVLFVSSGFAQRLYTVETLPSPKEAGQDFYVSNPDGVLSSETVDQLNRLSTEIEETSGAEYAIVVVNDFEGYDVFEFALKLFNTWGIGKQEQNNGLLLFIAKDKREYRFISGYGMEAIFPDVYLHRIGEKFLVPHFREGDYNRGVLEASQAIQQALTAPDVQAELHRMMPEATPFFSKRNPYFVNSMVVILLYVALYYWVYRVGRAWTSAVWTPLSAQSGKKRQKKGCGGWFVYMVFGGFATIFTMLFVMMIFAFVLNDMERMFQLSTLPWLFAVWGSYTVAGRIWETRDAIKKSYKDEENKLKALQRFQLKTFIPYLLSPLMLFSFFLFRQKWKDSKIRFVPPDDSGNWERINRDMVKLGDMKRYLSQGQLKEENLHAKFYEVWINKKTGERKVLGWTGKTKLAVCPSCGFRTYEKGKRGKILKVATYKESGLQQVYDHCLHCKHKEDKGTRVIPKLVRSSGGSGSSGGGSFSGGSSGGGGGSFGGGSSGGGGAGGRW
ncbi:TPM domain-containing protein [Sphingobacterium corticibacterium]|uniref:TPM domain-containing protein n=1 Tax=Sphingobacterium corticibacterium TaxID=2484746 RepID=UPI0019D261A6|nr:TPM domain-containing protein [Sphingobacterium corticibacterium]